MSARTDGARGAALVAEDEYLVSLGVTSLLEDLGFRVIGPAARLADGCAAAEQEPIALAVLDINLAGEMSWPLARLLRARHIPVLFLSGYLESNAMRPDDLLDVPMCPKPFSDEELQAQIERLLRAAQDSVGRS